MKDAEKWKENAVTDVVQHPGIIENADRLAGFGIKSKDSLHIACAIHAECDYFLTTDDKILNKSDFINEIKITDPVTFIKVLSE